MYEYFLYIYCMMHAKREQMINNLRSQKYIKSKKVEDAFLRVPREQFVPQELKRSAYADSPLMIGEGQTISAPHMVAIMAEALDVEEGQKILEIGAGSGYHAAIIAALVGDSGQVYSVERFPGLAEKAQQHLKKAGVDNVTIEIGDGSEGLEQHAPYDRIYVTCASPAVPPPLLDQLKVGGKLLIPVGGMYCELQLLIKKEKGVETKHLGGCSFVPLVGKYGH